MNDEKKNYGKVQNVYSIYDRVVEEYSYPFCSTNHNSAVRQFTTSISRSPEMGLNKRDYSLRYVAQFDMETGEMSAVEIEIVFEGEMFKKETEK